MTTAPPAARAPGRARTVAAAPPAPAGGPTPARSGSSSLDRGLQILAFVQDHGPAAVADVAAGLEIPVSTTYRYTAALIQRGFLVEMDKQLVASSRLADATAGYTERLPALAAPTLDRLATRTGLSAALTVRVHTVALCLDTRRTGIGPLAYRPGQAMALHAGASATPLLAMAPATVRRRVLRARLARFTAQTPDRAQLLTALEEIRRHGHHRTSGWLTPGMSAVGVPVMVGADCVCALSLIGKDPEMGETGPLAGLLTEEAAHLSRRLRKNDVEGTSLVASAAPLHEEIPR